MTYLTFVGTHDRFEGTLGRYGAVLSIFSRYQEQIQKVFLLVTPPKKRFKIDYHEIARQNKMEIERLKPGISVHLRSIDVASPIDFSLVYSTLLCEIQTLIEQGLIGVEEKIINITSGTPTMSTCWVLLHSAGILSPSKLIQSFEPEFATPSGEVTKEVNLTNIDGFPLISPSEALRQQLIFTARQKEQYQEELFLQSLDARIPELLGTSQKIREIKAQIYDDIDEETHVLILGERGSGKGVVAQAIWRLYRKPEDKEFTTFDCGAIPKELICSELFGYVKGAFTGATQDHPGILSGCHQKMLFLDEIGNLPLEGQQALLRFLNDGEIRKVGSRNVDKVRTQIIAATNKNVDDPEMFALDLKDRFDEVIQLPSLRSRKEDIPLLIDHFLRRYQNETPLVLQQDIIAKLKEHDWPNNIRGLEKWVQRLARRFKQGGVLTLKDLPPKYISDLMKPDEDEEDLQIPELPLKIGLEEYTQKIIEKARNIANGNMADVDRLLHQNPGTEKQRQYRLKKNDRAQRHK